MRRDSEDYLNVLFAGEFEGHVDSHGRIAVPAVFAEALSGVVVVARGFERCVSVYSEQGWQRIASEIRDLPATNAKTRRLARFIFASAHEQEADRQGRIELPKTVLRYAGINRDVVVIGTGEAVEIWDRESWAQELDAVQARVSDAGDSTDSPIDERHAA
ncbi:MAG: division/cell wall cluster transcriptional repressor MraZ [Dehalococcoidia bacterium]|nr:division/cell wall cluster transcriptional repressor MraZ [Dehalococcoidia bacterium]